MIGLMVFSFLVGGIVGMLGMAILSSGPKLTLFRDNFILLKRLNFLEREGHIKRYKPVEDPRKKVEELIN